MSFLLNSKNYLTSLLNTALKKDALVNTNYERFAVIGHARTGSNYLSAGLRTTKRLKMFNEIFASHIRKPGEAFDKIFATLFSKQPVSITHVGFKVFYYHFNDEEWNKFLKNNSFLIIHLLRRNYLRTIVSLELAFKTDQWISAGLKERIIEKSVNLDPVKVVQRLNYIKEQEILTRCRFKDWQFMEVVYEDLANNPEKEFKRIGDFLKISNINISKINLKKQNPEPLKKLIKNYDEVATALHQTIYFQCLET